MPNDNIFEGGDPTPPVTPETPAVTPPTPSADPALDLLGNIKGDDGQPKYKDVPTALSALQHSQEYIKQLKAELEETKTKAAQAMTMEQVLAAINKPEAPPTNSAPSSPGLTAEDVMRILTEKERAEAAKLNTRKVAQRFKEVHGEKAEEAFYTKASEMGLSKEAVNQLAATSPEAVFSMFGMKGGGAPAPTTPSGINTTNMQAPTPQSLGSVMGFKKDSELVDYWQKIKQEVNANLGIK
jgi:hypothetical protein